MTKPLNITPKRLAALRFLASKKGSVRVSMLADEVLHRQSRFDPARELGYSRQQATRTGAGCAVPLIKAGFVAKEYQTYGWGNVSITQAGLDLLAEIDKPAAKSLDDVLAKCVEA